MWLTNTGWSLADQTTRIILGGIVVIALSRHFGPRDFGSLVFAISMVKIFSIIAILGLDRIVVRRAVVDPDSAFELLRMAGMLRFCAGLSCYALLLLSLKFFSPASSDAFRLGAVAGIALFFQPFDVIDSYFQSRQSIRLTVASKTSAFAFCSGLKLLFVYLSLPLLSFAGVDALEAFLAAAALSLLFWRSGESARPRPQPGIRSLHLLRDGAPVLLASFAVILYMRVDVVMLGTLRDSTAAGIYVAASQLSVVWAFLPMAIAPAAFPILMHARTEDMPAYNRHMRWLLQFIVLAALAVILALYLFAPILVRLLFGVAYLDAVNVLRIHALSIVFVFLGVIQGAWDLSEDLVWLAAWRTAAGALLNILLNLWLIPARGAAGAATATVISYAVSTTAMLAISPRTRKAFVMHLEALSLFTLIGGIRRLSTGEIRSEWNRLTSQQNRSSSPPS
jgi:PST family polysaccharide transporter